MAFDPVHWNDYMRAQRDPAVRGAGAGGALLIYIVGGLFLFGPFIWMFVSTHWVECLVTLGILIFLTIIGCIADK